MSGSFLFGLIAIVVIAWLNYLDIKAAYGPHRRRVGSDGLSLLIGILILLWSCKVAVFEHSEVRIGLLAGVFVGVAVGLFDLRRTRIRNTPDGMFAWSSRIVTTGFLVASGLWAATHHGGHRISVDEVSDNPLAMFFCTTSIAYAIVYINGLYSGRRFESASPSRKNAQSPDRTEYGSRRRGRR